MSACRTAGTDDYNTLQFHYFKPNCVLSYIVIFFFVFLCFPLLGCIAAMRPIATDGVAWYVCLFVGHGFKPCKNG